MELGGETGELLNKIKKVERGRLKLAGSKNIIELYKEIEEEMGDVLICLDLIAMEFGMNLEKVTKDKFNKSSDKFGLETKFVQ